MKPTSLLALVLVVGTLACGGASEPPAEELESGPVGEPAGEGSILRLDPRLDSLVPPGATIEKVAEGYTFTEGPVWIRGEQRLLFSDVRANAIHQWTEPMGPARSSSRSSKGIAKGSGPSRPTASPSMARAG